VPSWLWLLWRSRSLRCTVLLYDAILFLLRNTAIAEPKESTQPAKVGFFQLCGSKCRKQIASKVFYIFSVSSPSLASAH
jgi:hypothetical protein